MKPGDRVRFITRDDTVLDYGTEGVVTFMHQYEYSDNYSVQFETDTGRVITASDTELVVVGDLKIGDTGYDRLISDTVEIIGIDDFGVTVTFGDGSGPYSYTHTEFERDVKLDSLTPEVADSATDPRSSAAQEAADNDPVKKPSHYRQVPGIECIDVIKHFNFPVGSAIKYLWRHEHKGDPIENLRKAIENIEFEIARRQSGEG